MSESIRISKGGNSIHFRGASARAAYEDMTGHKIPTVEAEEKKVREFNQHNVVGQPVNVRKDDGTIFETSTRSEAWLMGGHTAMVLVNGITGGYMVDRVTQRLTTQPESAL